MLLEERALGSDNALGRAGRTGGKGNDRRRVGIGIFNHEFPAACLLRQAADTQLVRNTANGPIAQAP